jgi:hypothetical protein
MLSLLLFLSVNSFLALKVNPYIVSRESMLCHDEKRCGMWPIIKFIILAKFCISISLAPNITLISSELTVKLLFCCRFEVLWSTTSTKYSREVIVWNCWLTRLQLCKETQCGSNGKLAVLETLFGGEMSSSRKCFSLAPLFQFRAFMLKLLVSYYSNN